MIGYKSPTRIAKILKLTPSSCKVDIYLIGINISRPIKSSSNIFFVTHHNLCQQNCRIRGYTLMNTSDCLV